MPNNNILELQNLVSGYRKSVIVKSVSIQVKKGNIVALVGPNGSGKTTLLKSVYGITHIFEGKIYFEDKDITTMRSDKVTKLGIGFLPQISNVFTGLTVQENLEMGAYTRNDRDNIESDMKEKLALFPGLKDKKKQKAGTLSGGEREMLAVARALMTNPKLLLMDEPVASLSPLLADRIFETIKKIRDSGVTIVLVSHFAKRALNLADYAYVLVAGQKVHEGKGLEVLNNPDIGDIFLGFK